MTRTLHIKHKATADDGQSFVEFALVLPVVLLVLFMFMKFVVVFHNYLAITDAARVGARKAAVSRTPASGTTCDAAKAAVKATVSTAQWNAMSVSCSPSTPGAVGTPYTVSIDFPVTIKLMPVPLIGTDILPPVSFTMKTSATERLE
jgi:Flp pilus assembly protein TadG